MSAKTSKEEVEIWLNENLPHIKLIEWCGKASGLSKFFDENRNKNFEYKFALMKSFHKKWPNRIFGATKEEHLEQIKKANLEKYGVEYSFQAESVKNNIKKSIIKKYGVENPSLSKGIQEKRKNTFIERFGVENPGANENIKEKIRQTNLEKYGVSWSCQAPEVVNKIQNIRKEKGLTFLIEGKTLKEIAKEKNCCYTNLTRLYHQYGEEFVLDYEGRKQSSLEFLVQKFLTENKIDFKQRTYINPYYPDFLIPSYNLIVECDGLYWHSELRTEEKEYHRKKKEYYKNLGYSSLFFREDELKNNFEIVKSIILNKLQLSKKIYARKCTIENYGDLYFFEQNHLMGKGSGRIYSLKINDEIVCAIQVKWKNKKEKILEISRFAPKIGLCIIGGFSKLISFIIKTENPKKIITFIDKRYGDGNYLIKLNWNFVNESLSFKWVDLNKERVYHRMNFPSNTGYDVGLTKIYDCGQAKWELNI